MDNYKLKKLYNSTRANCCKCGRELYTNNGVLGTYFVLDTDGNFYCTECDSIFEDFDERIYEPDLYDEDE